MFHRLRRRLAVLSGALPGKGRRWGLLRKAPIWWVFAASTLLVWALILAMIGWALAPTLADRLTVGSHDWDQMESHRYLITKTIFRFHQFPFWNPYACGGHPNWGGFESGTTIVSPWFPFYLAMKLPHAMRVEVWGSAVLSAVGAWLLAGRFTRSPAARAFVVVVFAVNGRWALQTTSGHTWHLAYEWTPWALYFFDRAAGCDVARGSVRFRDVVLCAACVAMMVYMGGIYPLPETIFALALYGIFLSALMRSGRPLGAGIAAGLLALGLSAPKLFPVFEVLSRHPRLVDSTETLDLKAFVDVLTSHDQDITSAHAGVSQWGWHEWGMYVGWPAVIAIVAGTVFGRGSREQPMKWAGLVLLSLGFGAFDPHAPWPLLHHVPVFKSQHVPSRWMYPALLFLATVAAALAERILRRVGRLRGLLEVTMIGGVAWIARDIATVSRESLSHVFSVKMPSVAESVGPFRTEIHLPSELAYTSDWVSSSLSAEMANIGTLDCGTFPAFHSYFRDQNGRVAGAGARGRGDAAYKGEVFVPDGVGKASIQSWSPNEVKVVVSGAQAGEHVVLNQNWDPGWSADGTLAVNWSDTVAAQLHGPDSVVVFRYRPPTFIPGLLVCAATLGGLAWAYVRRRKRYGVRVPLSASARA
jgi:hypothetical protein